MGNAQQGQSRNLLLFKQPEVEDVPETSMDPDVPKKKSPLNASTLKCPSEPKPLDIINLQMLGFARDGDITMLRMALLNGANVETRRPMTVCPREEDPQAGDFLDEMSQQGMTPLMYSAQGGHLRCVQMLLAEKACVHAREEDGLQPLHFAACSGNFDVAHELVKAGAGIGSCDHSGKCAIDYLPEEVTAVPAALREWRGLLGPQAPPHCGAAGRAERNMCGSPGRCFSNVDGKLKYANAGACMYVCTAL